jgi:hypothetical protein
MQTKFEQLLDYLVNEETEKANELFHQIVVEKSRGIYENLISDEEKEEKNKNDDDKTEEGYGGFGEESVIEIGGDATDDLMRDVEFDDDGLDDEGDDMDGMDDMGDEFSDEGEEEGTDARIDDLEDALAELKAEFEQLMAGEEGEENADDMGMDDMGDEEDEEQDEQFIREYTEKVSDGHGAEKKGAGEKNVNARSPNAGENRMGGTAFKLGAGGEEKGGTQGGLLNPSAKDLNSGNVNKPGGTNAKQFYSKDGKGHGAEKRGSGESAGNTKSPLSPSHAK